MNWRSENIRIGLKQRAANGTSGLYDRPCYGYYKDKNGMLAIDEKTAEVVRNIFDWYLEGASAVGIKKQLESKQIKSPKGKDTYREQAYDRIHPDQHEIYRDVAIADSGDSGNRYKLGDHHTGIISKEKFEVVQIELARCAAIWREQKRAETQKYEVQFQNVRNNRNLSR